MRRAANMVLSALVLSFITLIPASIHAQIVHDVIGDISHPFIVGQATLPPGEYVFQMMPHTDLSVMTVTSKDNDTSVEFLVRPSLDSQVPNQSELVFNRYGQKDFLINVFERGIKLGIAVVEPSREESRLLKEGETPVQHTEVQRD
jgi:hypothetical protein